MNPSPVIIALDGPAAAGKSTVARLLAERLGYLHLNSGALYRGVALLALRMGVSENDEARLAELARNAHMEFGEKGRFVVNGEDVTLAIRTPEVDALVSRISVWKSVRAEVTRHQRRIAATQNVVVEGRDVTTVVFPNATVKFFVTASVEERARRRFFELRERGENVPMETLLAEICCRDERDSTRHESPLRIAEDAILLDTTDKTPEEVVSLMTEIVQERLQKER